MLLQTDYENLLLGKVKREIKKEMSVLYNNSEILKET